MARGKEKLGAQFVERVAEPGEYADGGGLFLQVTRAGDDRPVRKSWFVRYRAPDGRTRKMGLGAFDSVPLKAARAGAEEARKLAASRLDPIEHKKAKRAQAAAEAAKAMTFAECAAAYIDAHKAAWRNPKHGPQWAATLETYAFPVMGKLPVSSIDTPHVLAALRPIWPNITETASRVRGRIEMILDYAKAAGYRTGENPARWRGHLSNLLPKRSKAQRVKHHPSLPYANIPAFMRDLRSRPGDSARMLEFTILTAARTNEAMRARWAEIDLKAKLWTIPKERTKAYRAHRVPLSEAVLEILKTQRAAHPDAHYVFPGPGKRPAKGERLKGRKRADAPLTNMAMLKQLERMGRDHLTVHGFRSTFRTWAGERTAYPRELIEAALAHVIGDETEAAYMRGDLFDKRAKLMDAWAAYCASKPAVKGNNVANLRSAERA